jgi:hypothetical protein
MLSDLATVKTYLRITPAVTSADLMLAQRLAIGDRIIKSWCKQPLETAINQRFLSGEGEVDLAIPTFPIQAPVFTGTLTNGAATFTSMVAVTPYPVAANGTVQTGTQNLMVGMPAAIVASSGPNATLAALPILTNIKSVDSPTQVTLNNNATVSGTFNIVFGLDVYIDASSGYGDSAGAFQAPTQMFLGNNYILKRDGNDGSSHRALIQRTGGGPFGVGGWGGLGWGTAPIVGGGPLLALTVDALPRWPGGFGNIKVLWCAGYGTGATPPTALAPTGGSLPVNTTIPYELTDALNKIVGWDRLTTPVGIPQDLETWSKGAMHQLNGVTKATPEMMTVRATLARGYRDFSIGGI